MVDYEAYRDASLSIGDRVNDLLHRMTLEEKAAQVASPFGPAVDVHTPPSTGWGSATAALSTLGLLPRDAAERGNELQRKHIEDTRLGIPILLAEEALLGLKVRDATTFPDAIAQAATWDPALIETVGALIGAQMAALGVRQALSPLADVARDPRWGRVEETYGEDPYLVGTMATAFVRGLQNADPDAPLIATLKHFIGYSASDGGRNTETAQLGPRELREVHGVPFEMAIRTGGARGAMPSYNDIDGVPVTGSRAYLTDLLRGEFGFSGLVISDLGAVGQLHTKHGTAQDVATAFAQAIRAGVDLDLDNRVSSAVIVDAVRAGVLTEPELDRAVASVLRAKFQLGLFENPYVDVEKVPKTFDTSAERALARTVAQKSVTLLKNDPVDGAPLLPLSADIRTIAVIGPNAHRPLGQLGHYSYQILDSMTTRFAFAADPQSRPEDVAELAGKTGPDDVRLMVESVPIVTFLEGIQGHVGEQTNVVYEPGCAIAAEDRSGFASAVEAATSAEVAIVVVGDQAGINGFGTVGEGLDSTDLALPGVQRELVEAIVATGTPTIVILSHGRPYVLGWMADTVPAIVSTWFGGEEAGNAAADVLFGDINPAGRLPIAFLASAGAAPTPYWRTLQNPAYVDGTTASVFPFGHGLSYTSFEYRDLEIESSSVSTRDTIRIAFTVANIGECAGDEVVQVYGRDVIGRTARRSRVLLAFQRVTLDPGEELRVVVEIPCSMFALWDPSDSWVVEPGQVKLFIGASSADIRLRGSVTLTGQDHHPGRDRDLTSTVTVGAGPMHFVPRPSEGADDARAVTVSPLTAESTIKEWFDHPIGAAVLSAALDGADEESLAPAFGLTLPQMIMYSQGALPESLTNDLLARVVEQEA